MLPLDLAANAESLGARVIAPRRSRELRGALAGARGADGPVVVYIETDRYAGVPGYESWWDVPVAEVSERGQRCGPRARNTSATTGASGGIYARRA